jgi:hypothetical protein
VTVERPDHIEKPFAKTRCDLPSGGKPACRVAIQAAREADQTGEAKENGLVQWDERRHWQCWALTLEPQGMWTIGIIHDAAPLTAVP